MMRFLSLSLLLPIFILGVLPLSEVSSNSDAPSLFQTQKTQAPEKERPSPRGSRSRAPDFVRFSEGDEKEPHQKSLNLEKLMLTQSGYQALYGGVTSPFNRFEVAQDYARKAMAGSKALLEKEIEKQRSGFFAGASPFMLAFWVAGAGMVFLSGLMPLSNSRLRYSVFFATIMLATLIVLLIRGTPLETLIQNSVDEGIRQDPQNEMILSSAWSMNKAPWFWVALALVVLAGVTEVLTNLLWKNVGSVTPAIRAQLITAAVVILVPSGIIAQFVNWDMKVKGLVAQVAELDRIEQEKLDRAAAEAQAKEKERIEAKEKAEAQVKHQKALMQAAADKAYQDAEKLKLQIHHQQMQQEADLVKKKQEEINLQKKKKEQADEAAKAAVNKKKEDLESRGLPWYPEPTTPLDGKNADQWSKWPFEKSQQVSKGRPKSAKVLEAERQKRRLEAYEALRLLREEGMPFLMGALEKESTPDGLRAILRHINIDFVHPNDLGKIASCLAQRWEFSNRMLALEMLSKRPESKKHSADIETLVKDLLNSRNLETRNKARKLFDTIKAASDK